MPSTYTLIKGETLASSAASYTFTAIPSTFTDLALRVSARDDFATTGFSLRVRFNGDTSSVYSWTEITGNGSTAASGNAANQSGRMDFYSTNGNTSTANTFGSAEIYIPNYTVSQNKPMSGFGAAETNATNVNYLAATANLWRNTAAITSITFTALVNFLPGSSFYLYGIKNS